MATEFTIPGVTITQSHLDGTQFPFASLPAPTAGTLPTFSTAPVVFIRNADTRRYLVIDGSLTDTTGFTVLGGDLYEYGDDPPYSVVLGIITTDVTQAADGVGTAVGFPYYCSIIDVQDLIFQRDKSFGAKSGTTVPLHNSRLRRFISKANAKVNAALRNGRYSIPAVNTVKQLISNSLTASTNIVTLNSVEDGDEFSIGDTVRIHGTSSNVYNDEFTNIVSINSDVIDVEFLENSYDANATIERVLPGMDTLRHITAEGAAEMALGGQTARSTTQSNNKIERLSSQFEKDLEAIREGDLVLEGLTRESPISSYAYQNRSTLPNEGLGPFSDPNGAGSRIKF